MNCAHSPIAITIATPAKTAVAAGVERVSVASRTASRPTANSALVAAKACVRRLRLTTPGAGKFAKTKRRGVFEKKKPNSPPPPRGGGLPKRAGGIGKKKPTDPP